eukprot:TRINITY_DN3995_c0_g1_i8.p1 TRINITY_DN3995_c0_g1~~TRINITY_DN3995_c0_g1_i8.p1  ORF type:complete len:362 (-),score=43.94 TRINITY_DN3995_c0_g1_i8:84-1169(-)
MLLQAIVLLLPATICQAVCDVCDDDSSNDVSLLQSSTQLRMPRTIVSQWDPSAKVCDNFVQVRGSTKPMPSVGYIPCCTETDTMPSVALQGGTRFLKRGGRLLDTAQLYGNEGAIGEAIQRSGVPRAEIFVSTKLDPSKVPSTGVREWVAGAVRTSLQTMKLSYLDVMHIHFGPTAASLSSKKITRLTAQQHLEIYKGLIDAQKRGEVLNLGVCLHTRSEIEHLARSTGVQPAIAMFWYSPFMPEVTHDYKHWLQSQGIAVVVYGTLNWKYDPFPHQQEHMRSAMEVADRNNATFGRIIIRWALDEKVAVITSMANPTFLNEDLYCLQNPLSRQDHLSLASSPKWTCKEIEPIQPLMGCYP